ncbi:MAG: M23 family metallopeptidase, partial [bacterium]|nr:M23 family metallopeptidase [bacterium]
DYRNGWYHTASGRETVTQVAALYQRDADLVAVLNHASSGAVPAAGRMLYIPPSNNIERVREVVARIRNHLELVPTTPWNPAGAGGRTVPVVNNTTPVKIKRSDLAILERDPLPERTPRPGGGGSAGGGATGAGGGRGKTGPGPRDGFEWPVEGRIVARFEEGWKNNLHGIEIAAEEGKPVRAARGGKVLLSRKFPGYGNLILIDHGDGFASTYGYNDAMLVKEGDRVNKGQTIASVGRPSQGSSSRLFFQIRRGGQMVDPLDYLSY